MIKKNLDLLYRTNVRNIAKQFLLQYDGALCILDPHDEYKIIGVNQYLLDMTGYSQLDLLNNSILNFMENGKDRVKLIELLNSKEMFRKTFKHSRKNGSVFWMELYNMPLSDEEGNIVCNIVFASDKTEEFNSQSLISLEREVYRSLELGTCQITVFEQIANYISTTLQKGCQCSFLIFNDEELLEAMPGNLSKTIRDSLYPLERKRNIESYVKELKGDHSLVISDLRSDSNYQEHLELLETEGYKSFWCESIFDLDGTVIGQYVLYFKQPIYIDNSDIAYLHKVSSIVSLVLNYYKQRKEILELAYYDSGTSLSNINLFKVKLERQLLDYLDGSVVIFRPTEYAQIVDVFGSKSGDELIKQLAKRLEQSLIQDHLTIARYSNSAIICLLHKELIEKIEQSNILNSITEEPFIILGKKVYITLKAGHSIVNPKYLPEKLIQQADIALSFAMKQGGNILKVFTPSLHSILSDEIDVLSHLSTAFNRNEFVPMLQPKVDIKTKEIVGFEALARWNSEELGFISPAMFIPVAESTGSVYKIDRQILRHVLEWQKKRMEQGKRLYTVSVNISASHFYYPTFVENCMELINMYGVDTRYICFEITESIELENISCAREIILKLNKYGIRTSIDDFGKGYSSLSYLQQLNFKEIKIDKSFIDDIEQNKMKAVVKGIIYLAEAVEMISVAEGIETEEQYEVLKEIGCQVGQGYYFYKPMSFEQIEKIIDKPSCK